MFVLLVEKNRKKKTIFYSGETMTIGYRQIRAFKLTFITFWVFLDCQQILKKITGWLWLNKVNSDYITTQVILVTYFCPFYPLLFLTKNEKKDQIKIIHFTPFKFSIVIFFPYYLSFVPIFLTKGIISQIYYKFFVMYYYVWPLSWNFYSLFSCLMTKIFKQRF